ncbi:MAG TPA: hypothetical protein VFJ90_14325, partial [Candidatus Didemnitutus sp.]|nr:hypothetical protein [Candidatus Didemnitutus sp.]
MPAFAANEPSEAELIRQELQKLKQDYEKRMADLEGRLRKIEEAPAPYANAKPAAAVTAPVAAAPAAVVPADANAVAQQKSDAGARVEREFQQDTETREHALLQADQLYKQRLEEVLGGYIKMGAYLRAGYGRNGEGGPQVGFQAPG